MKNTTRWLIIFTLIGIGAVNALVFIVRLPFFWDINRLSRFILWLLGALILVGTNICFFDKAIIQRKKFILVIGLGIIYFLLCNYLISIPLPENTETSWLRGLGIPIMHALDSIFLVVLFAVPVSLLIKKTVELIRSNKPDSVHSKNKSFYHFAFLCSFIILCFLPLKNLPDIHSMESTFWGRDEVIRAYQAIRLLAGDRVYEKSILSDNNWLVYTGDFSIADYQNSKPFTEQQLEKIYTNLDELQSYLESKGITLLIVVPPNKNTIYPEYVPDEIPVMGEISRLDQVLTYQQEHDGVELLDLRPVFLEAKKERLVYYATDSHWNQYGAFLAYREIILALNKQFSNLQPYALGDFNERTQKMVGDTATIAKINISEEIPVLKLKDSVNNRTIDLNSITIYINDQESLPDMIIFHDSFSEILKQFLPLSFHKSVFINKSGNDLDISFIEAEKPDVVLLEFTERNLSILLNNILVTR